MFIAFFLSCFLTLIVSYCQIPTVNFNDFQETSSELLIYFQHLNRVGLSLKDLWLKHGNGT